MGHDIEIMLPQSVVLPVSYWVVSVIGKNQFCSEPMEVLPWLISLSIGVTVFIPSIKAGSSDLGESCRVTVDSITSRLVLLIEVCSPVACIAWNCTYGLRQALLGVFSALQIPMWSVCRRSRKNWTEWKIGL